MKKIALAVFAAIFALSMVACSRTFTVEGAGATLTFPKEAEGRGLVAIVYTMEADAHDAIALFYSNEEESERLKNEYDAAMAAGELTEEFHNKIMNELRIYNQPIFVLELLANEEYEDTINNEELLSKYEVYEKIGEREGFAYVRFREPLTTEEMSEKVKADFDYCVQEVEKAFEKIKFSKKFTRGDASVSTPKLSNAPKELKSFNTIDLYGNPVDASIFSQKKLTVLNVWGTFCAPCIFEMPDLAQWAKSMGDDVQLVGLVSDIDINAPVDIRDGLLKDAKDILSEAEADFLNILPGEGLYEFLNSVEFIPVTFLIDSKGNCIGEPIVGAFVEKYKAAVENYFASK